MSETVGLRERIGAYFREHAVTTSRKLDLYLSENMPDLIDKHKLATKNDLSDVDKCIESFEQELDQLEAWRTDTEMTVGEYKTRMERLELKYGVSK